MQPTRERLRIVTYNLHRCVGRDGVYAPERTAAVLRALAPDVVALQEVESGTPVPGGRAPALMALAAALGMHAVAGPAVRGNPGVDYGNAVLARHPVRRDRLLMLGIEGREARAALDVTLDVDGRALRVVTTHLGLRGGERRVQASRLLDALATDDAELVALAGDFNEWLPSSRVLRWLHARFGTMPARRTFPARRPMLALDRIWVSPPERVRSVGVDASPVARIASDHLPFFADVAWS